MGAIKNIEHTHTTSPSRAVYYPIYTATGKFPIPAEKNTQTSTLLPARGRTKQVLAQLTLRLGAFVGPQLLKERARAPRQGRATGQNQSSIAESCKLVGKFAHVSCHRLSEARDVARGAAQSAPVEPCCTLLNPVAPDRTRPASGMVCVLNSTSACAPYQ